MALSLSNGMHLFILFLIYLLEFITLFRCGMHDQAAAASLRLDGSTLPGGKPTTAEAVMQVSRLAQQQNP